MLAPHDQIAVNTLFILLLITVFGWWVITKYYSMAERIENLEEELDDKYPISQSTVNHAVKRDIEMLIKDLISHEDKLLALDNRYKVNNEWNVSKFEDITNVLKKLNKEFLKKPTNPLDFVKQPTVQHIKNNEITMAEASEIEADA